MSISASAPLRAFGLPPALSSTRNLTPPQSTSGLNLRSCSQQLRNEEDCSVVAKHRRMLSCGDALSTNVLGCVRRSSTHYIAQGVSDAINPERVSRCSCQRCANSGEVRAARQRREGLRHLVYASQAPGDAPHRRWTALVGRRKSISATSLVRRVYKRASSYITPKCSTRSNRYDPLRTDFKC